MKEKNTGFALVDALVAVMVGGAIVAAISQWLRPDGMHGDQTQQRRILEQAHATLTGYASANARLPTSDDGWLPSALAPSGGGNRIRYYVAPALTSIPASHYTPHGLVSDAKASPGLDFCLKLAQAGKGELLDLGSGADSVSVAVVLEYSSSAATGSSVADVALPGTELAHAREVQGRFSRGISPTELFTALGCPDRIARTASATKYRWALLDMFELAKANTQHKRVDLQVAQAQMDESALGLAQLLVTQAILVVDEAELVLGHGGKKPYDDEAIFAAAVLIYASSQAQLATTIALVVQTLDKWPALQATLVAAINDAQTKEGIVALALEDTERELNHYLALGLTP